MKFILMKRMKQVPQALANMRAVSVCLPRQNRGWTLIELLMVMAIMAILAGAAWPSYVQHVQRGHRMEAAAALLEAQHFMERYYSAYGRYSQQASGAAVAPVLPVRLQSIPGAEARYVLSVTQVSANSYTLSAVPTGSMAGDRCATLTLSHTTVRNTTSSVATAAECWR